jgi:beta-lactamase superfamily II metal-dependent hydrolase
MSEIMYINCDLAKVKIPESGSREAETRVLAWGDEVNVIKEHDDKVEIEVFVSTPLPNGSVKPEQVSGFIKKKSKKAKVVTAKKEVLKVDFVDVQQGDGSVIETPEGDVILIDGGDNQLFARYLASRFRGTSKAKPQDISCILVTHGDADHFLGLPEIQESETNAKTWKRLFIRPQNVFHNGLVKRPGTIKGKSVPDKEMLGATKEVKNPETNKKVTIITELEDNLLEVDDAKMNEPFQTWKKVLKIYNERSPINIRRLKKGDDAAFNFLKDKKLKVQVLGPLTIKSGADEGLKFLGEPPQGVRVGKKVMSLDDEEFKGFSASHTINGHSVILRVSYGKFNFLFAGDLNDEAERGLSKEHDNGAINLQCEVLKVPHHGSADFSSAFLKRVAPGVSVISAGDESARKEFIHPRANLVGALGKYSRTDEPIIFVTEMVAFFQTEGYVSPEYHTMTEAGKKALKNGVKLVDTPKRKEFYSFSRAMFGLVSVRTDGERLMVFINSANQTMKEFYSFTIKSDGSLEPIDANVC